MKPSVAVMGTMIWILSAASSIFVLYYFYLVMTGQPPDFKLAVGGKQIPPEVYPILLLSIWTLLQRANANSGIGIYHETNRFARVCFWEDVLEQALVILFLVFAIGKMLTTETSMTFIVVLAAFLLQAVGDFVLNFQHRSVTTEPIVLRSGNTTAASSNASGGTVAPSDEPPMDVNVGLRFTHMRIGDGPRVRIPNTIELIPVRSRD